MVQLPTSSFVLLFQPVKSCQTDAGDLSMAVGLLGGTSNDLIPKLYISIVNLQKRRLKPERVHSIKSVCDPTLKWPMSALPRKYNVDIGIGTMICTIT
jgi:hypothetical protein